MSLQGFDYGDVVHKFEKRCKLEYLRVRDRFIEIIIYEIFSLTFLSPTLTNFSGSPQKNGVGFGELYPT